MAINRAGTAGEPGYALLIAAGPSDKHGKQRVMDATAALPQLAAVAPAVLLGTPAGASVVQLVDPADPQTVLTHLRTAAAHSGPVLVYLAGQLTLDAKQRMPHLALARTTPRTARYTALPWHWIAAELGRRPAGGTTLIADLVGDETIWPQLAELGGPAVAHHLAAGLALYGTIAPVPPKRQLATPHYSRALASLLRGAAERPQPAHLHERAALEAGLGAGPELLLAVGPMGEGAGLGGVEAVPSDTPYFGAGPEPSDTPYSGAAFPGMGSMPAGAGFAGGEAAPAGAAVPRGAAWPPFPAPPLSGGIRQGLPAPGAGTDAPVADSLIPGGAPAVPPASASASESAFPSAPGTGTGSAPMSAPDATPIAGQDPDATPGQDPEPGRESGLDREPEEGRAPGPDREPDGGHETVPGREAIPGREPAPERGPAPDGEAAPGRELALERESAPELAPTQAPVPGPVPASEPELGPEPVPAPALDPAPAPDPAIVGDVPPVEDAQFAAPAPSAVPAPSAGATPSPAPAPSAGAAPSAVPASSTAPASSAAPAPSVGAVSSAEPGPSAGPSPSAPFPPPPPRPPHPPQQHLPPQPRPVPQPPDERHAAILEAARAGRHSEAAAMAAAWEQEAMRASGPSSPETVHWLEVRADLARLADDPARACELWMAAARIRLGNHQHPGDPDVEGAVDRAHHQWQQVQDPVRAGALAPALVELRTRVPGRRPGALAAARRRAEILRVQTLRTG
ncbi:hypothetical protein [Streptomyces sp. XD-27]|uniref:hypothetical protein n=1 Tax=Streptomyces sp. XD-27 TaxID=3062779 RepID=UPI0026F473CB|nr:hypothetical protein [Streptomyces sp. XD-27]WKX71780.1 hypothetical protein Q3Y56_19405 [Streptomyces sp. XD-27]